MCLSHQKRIYVLTAVIIGHFLVELVMSHLTHSLTLLTDAYHTLYNIVAVLGFIIAIKMSNENTLKNTFGWARIGVLGMLVSTLALTALSFSVLVEALQTIVHASHSDAMHYSGLVLCIGIFGIFVNIACFLVIGGLSYSPSFVSVDNTDVQVNLTIPQEVPYAGSKLWLPKTSASPPGVTEVTMRKRFLLDFCRDLSCSILVVVCAMAVYMTDGNINVAAVYIDPAISIASVIIMMATTYPFFKESGMILLQTVPNDMDVHSLKLRLAKEFPCIMNVHDLHVWRLTRTKVIATVHIRFTSPFAYSQVASLVTEFFTKEGIVLSTVQPEFEPCQDGTPDNSSSTSSSNECVLRCRKGECQSRMCCKEEGMEEDVGLDGVSIHSYCHSHDHYEEIPLGDANEPGPSGEQALVEDEQEVKAPAAPQESDF